MSDLAGRVHAPLARWAHERGQAIAIDDGHSPLSFAALHAAVQQAQAALADAPRHLLVDDRQPTAAQLVQFLSIVASDRCAAVSDPDWTPAVRQAVQALIGGLRDAPVPPSPTPPFYIGFTSGSTGVPKGFRRDHRSWTESFRVCVDTFGQAVTGTVLAPGRVSHSLFLFGMALGLWTGGGVVVQDRFSAPRCLQTLREGRATCLVVVPSQLLLMLEWAAHRQAAPIEATRLILISGARWMRERTAEVRALFPNARVVEFYGASETSFIAWQDAAPDTPPEVVGRPFANVQIDIRQRTGPQEPGLIFVRSPMLFMDYVGGQGDATAALREGDWLSVRDMGQLDAQGRLCLAGRQNRMIVTQGKNLFPDEVESVLLAHPAVAQASVLGLPDALRGQQPVAVLQWRAGQAPVPTAELAAWCRQRLEAHKVPRRFWHCADWPLTRSDKTDHSRLRDWLLAHPETPPCLSPLP